MSVRILVGDARERLRDLPDESVHCVVTSPPYWALRAYKGDPGMIGLEPSFEEHVENLLTVFREVRRVLRPDGTLWLNYGDAYASSARGNSAPGGGNLTNSNIGSEVEDERWRSAKGQSKLTSAREMGLKPKDLMMMPARIAMAMQNDGWWLRSEIIWTKKNSMPESVTDRPTSAHEKIFLFSKSARYFYDHIAVRTPATSRTTKMPDGWDTEPGAHGTIHRKGRSKGKPVEPVSDKFADAEGSDPFNKHGIPRHRAGVSPPADGGANLRNVWLIPTKPYKEAHFATFPPGLVEPCVKAGTSEKGCCSACGAPLRRSFETTTTGRYKDGKYSGHGKCANAGRAGDTATMTVGWSPSCCDCDEIIRSPNPDGEEREDPTLETGRKGMNRERSANDVRLMTRAQQRAYAKQIRESEHREDIRGLAGEAFAHYIRTDRSGARPMPPDLLDQCVEKGWLTREVETECNCACAGAEPVPCVVLDPFGGAGTVGLVADRLQRNAILIEISDEYARLAEDRILGDAPMFVDISVEERVND